MGFWSGEKLIGELPSLISNFRESRIDCAAYTLSVGSDIFVTEDQNPVGGVREGVRVTLQPNESFRIPPGQFAFVLTEEIVRVPNNALAFISMKATQKFKGLVNVSGFHVDPGWNGQLVFSVYNAGPAPVHLHQGMQLFLIWYCDLDRSSEKVKTMPTPQLGLKNELTSNMSGQVFSPMALGNQLKTLGDNVTKLREDIAGYKTFIWWFAGIIVTFAITFSVALFQLVGEPFRDFVLKEWAEHSSKSRNEQDRKNTSDLSEKRTVSPTATESQNTSPPDNPAPSVPAQPKQRSSK